MDAYGPASCGAPPNAVSSEWAILLAEVLIVKPIDGRATDRLRANRPVRPKARGLDAAAARFQHNPRLEVRQRQTDNDLGALPSSYGQTGCGIIPKKAEEKQKKPKVLAKVADKNDR